jgi:hypothetical protein
MTTEPLEPPQTRTTPRSSRSGPGRNCHSPSPCPLYSQARRPWSPSDGGTQACYRRVSGAVRAPTDVVRRRDRQEVPGGNGRTCCRIPFDRAPAGVETAESSTRGPPLAGKGTVTSIACAVSVRGPITSARVRRRARPELRPRRVSPSICFATTMDRFVSSREASSPQLVARLPRDAPGSPSVSPWSPASAQTNEPYLDRRGDRTFRGA